MTNADMSQAGIVDAWRHPSQKFLAEPMFESLRRWSGDGLADQNIPLEATIGAMDDAGVRTGDDVDFHRGI
jgi:uncharacterized protein